MRKIFNYQFTNMRCLPLVITALITATTVFGQITTTKVATSTPEPLASVYDGSRNFLGDNVKSYVGQELYLNGVSEKLRGFGYDGFTLDYLRDTVTDRTNIYKCCDGFNSKYDALVGKYFTVVDVIAHPKSTQDKFLYGSKYFLKLQEKESKDIVYFEYDSRYSFNFPFIVVGHFNWLKQNYIGKIYVIRGKNWISDEPMADISTGKPVSSFTAGAKWKVVDVSVEDRFYSLSLILQNEKLERIPYSVDRIHVYHFVIEFDRAEVFRRKFGDIIWQKILDGKVSIGMTKEMCEISWGTPKKINETISTGVKREQWVYEKNYLYFVNGVLNTIQ